LIIAGGYAAALLPVYRGHSEILHADTCRTWPKHGLGQMSLGQMSLRTRLSEKILLFTKKVIPPLQQDQRRQWCFSLDCNWPWRHMDVITMVTHHQHHCVLRLQAEIRPEWPKIEAAGGNRGRRPSWGPKGRKWGPQADTMANIKRPLVYIIIASYQRIWLPTGTIRTYFLTRV